MSTALHYARMARRATGKSGVPDEVVSLADSLHSAAIHLLRQLRLEDRASGIGPAQLSALSVLKPPTMVRIVRGLVEQGLASSRADKDDARRVSLAATARGRNLMQKARLRRVQALAGMLEGKSANERDEIAAAVKVLRSHQVPK